MCGFFVIWYMIHNIYYCSISFICIISRMKKFFFSLLFVFICIIVASTIYRYMQHPSNDRDRVERDAILTTSTIQWDNITIKNMRNFTRRSDDDFDKTFYDKTFDINDVQSVDYFLSTFLWEEKVGHTWLSFGLSDWSQIPISIEARKEKWEEYSPLKWLFNQYELAYVIADEQDITTLRTEVRGDPVYQYRLNVAAPQAQALLLSLLHTANDLSEDAVFYNTVVDNCTSVLRKHTNKISPGKLGLHLWLILTWLSDYYLFDQWLINTTSPRESLRTDHRINEKVTKIVGKDDFSVLLRE